MGELLHKIEKLAESGAVYFHRRVDAVQQNTVLIIVNIRGVLQAPAFAVYLYGNDAVILSCGVIDPSRIAHVFLAEHTFWVTALLGVKSRSDSLGILFGLGKIYGNVKSAVLGLGSPLNIFCNAVAANIVRVAA